VPHGNSILTGSNVALDGSGAANGASGTYVELPANILLGYGSIALEIWYTDQDGDGTGINRQWAQLWDFGSFGGHNLFVTPFVGGQVDTMRAVLNINNAGEWQVNFVRPLTNVEHHLVFVEDLSNRVATIYVDGVAVGQNINFLRSPRDLGPTPNNWLGRSQYGDPLFVGTIDEFRIYNGTLDPTQIGVDFITGPDTLMQGAAGRGATLGPPLGPPLGLRLARLPRDLHPPLLVRDLVALLDHGQVDEAGEGMRQQLQVLLPVPGRVGPRLHLIHREGQGRAVALLGGEPKLSEDDATADARGSSHRGRLRVT